MAKTNAQYQQEHRQRRAGRLALLEASAAGHERIVADLTARLGAALAEIERLEAELSAGAAARCPQCRGELACPRCYRSGDF